MFLDTHEHLLWLLFTSNVNLSVRSSHEVAVGDAEDSGVTAKLGDALCEELGAELGDSLCEELGAELGESLCEELGAELDDTLGERLGLSLVLPEGVELAETLGPAVGLINSVGEAVTATGALVGDLVNPSEFLVGEQEHVPPSAGSTTSSCDIIPTSS